MFLAAWLYVILFSIVHWFLRSDSEEVFLTYLTRRASRKEFAAALTPAGTGLLWSGEPIPDGLIMDSDRRITGTSSGMGVKSGNFEPGSLDSFREMAWSEWTVRIPSTTPASQAGLLHGDNFDIPAFRWFEKDAGKLIVANHPRTRRRSNVASPTVEASSPTTGCPSRTCSPAMPPNRSW